jgi:ABC transporter substrate binding protein
MSKRSTSFVGKIAMLKRTTPVALSTVHQGQLGAAATKKWFGSLLQRASCLPAPSFARDSNGGLIVLPSAFVAVHRQLIFEQTAQHRLPAVYGFRYFATDGGLMSYGVDVPDLFRRSATYVDRILKGAKPGELPVQAPVKFELVINLKTAKALGLDMPWFLQQRADEVIE